PAHPARQALCPPRHVVDEQGRLPLPAPARRRSASHLRAAPRGGAMKPFDGQIAVVTGASGAMGGALAATLAQEGARVILVGRDRARLAASATRMGAAAEIRVCDFARPGEPEKLAIELRDRQPRLDILAHAAGLFLDSDLASADDQAFERLLRVNLRAPLELTR